MRAIPCLWLACALAVAAAPPPARSQAAVADGPPEAMGANVLVDRLVALGFEEVRVAAAPGAGASAAAAGLRVVLENRRFRDPAFALGVVAAVLAGQDASRDCELILLRQGLPVARLRFLPEDVGALARGTLAPEVFADRIECEPLPDLDVEAWLAAGGPPGPPARSRARMRFDVGPRVTLDSQFGHIDQPFTYHLEIGPEISTQPWKGALLRASWAFPWAHGNDIPPDGLHPDYHQSRLGEAALFQFHRLGSHVLGSFSAGYFGVNRYGFSAGAGMTAGRSFYLDVSADLTGSLAFRPEMTYSGLTRVTFSGGATYRPGSPDLAFSVRGGRYLFGATAGSGTGAYAVRAEMARRFHQVEVGFFVVQAESKHYGGLRLSLPLPPAIRLRPNKLRLDAPPAFPAEYRTEEAPFEAQPVNSRLRAALLDDLWPSSIRAQWDSWIAGYLHVWQGQGGLEP
ncbi:MAG: YjbH domain-containing protein [Candidatus Eisenbacteria bacterium]|nr:YjbH domain-containing protein [Candidatus Eisenbacteria bacterium]